MTKQKLIEALKKLAKSTDPEFAHSTADGLLLDFIQDDDIRDAYDDVPAWYA